MASSSATSGALSGTGPRRILSKSTAPAEDERTHLMTSNLIRAHIISVSPECSTGGSTMSGCRSTSLLLSGRRRSPGFADGLDEGMKAMLARCSISRSCHQRRMRISLSKKESWGSEDSRCSPITSPIFTATDNRLRVSAEPGSERGTAAVSTGLGSLSL